MAFNSINKRLRGERTVYSTSVKQKNKGKIVFSKSKTFTSRTSALKWARGLITQLEADETSLVAGYKDIAAFNYIEASYMFEERERKLLLKFLAAPFLL